jgi:O-antigen/teichoic acid export membrane protein
VQGFNVAAARVTEVIVGLRLGAADLAVIRVAQKFFEILHGSLTSAVMAVWLPVLSRLREDPDGARAFFLRVMSLAAMLVIPAQLGLGLVGPEITRLFLSDEYARAAPLIGIISLAALIVPMSFFRAPILVALGKPGIGLVLAWLDLVLGAAAVYLFAAHGLVAAWSALAVVWFLLNPASAIIICRETRTPLMQFVQAIRPAYEASFVMAGAVLLTRQVNDGLPAFASLVLLACAGAAAYVGYLVAMHRKELLANIAYLRRRG